MRTIVWLSAAAVLLSPAAADAQVFGTFTWQMQPYCNRVTLTLTTTAGGFALSGFDDGCGAATKSSAVGVAVMNGDGTVGLNFTIISPPSGDVLTVSATVSPATGQGTWSDDVGNSGTFALGSTVGGLPVRPSTASPIDIADNPNEPGDPCGVTVSQPTLLLCGNSTARWVQGGFGLPGLQIWRDKDGQVHIRGSVTRTAGGLGGIIFRLPPLLTPTRTLGLTVSTGMTAGAHQGGTALLVVYGPDVPGSEGIVGIFSPSVGSHTVVHFGEIVFSVDR